MLIRIHTIFKNYPPNEFPKLYPESIDKFLINFGTKSEDFDYNKFIRWHEKNIKENQKKCIEKLKKICNSLIINYII